MATHDYRLISKFTGRIIKCEKGSINELAVIEEKLMGN
jgi:ABC-type ATPase involved in cell division